MLDFSPIRTDVVIDRETARRAFFKPSGVPRYSGAAEALAAFADNPVTDAYMAEAFTRVTAANLATETNR